LTGRVVVVTGGNGGIGFGIARAAIDAGADVMIWARSDRKSADAVARLTNDGGRAAAIACDVADERSVKHALEATVDRFERVDCLAANAAIPGSPEALVDMSIDNWRSVLDTNLTGVMLSFRAAARQMIAQDAPGALLAVSSIVARFGAARHSQYAVSKAAVHALVMSAAIELAPRRIRCNSFAPGWTRTDLVDDAFDGAGRSKFEQAIVARTPVRRWGTPSDYAAALVELLDPEQSFHTGDIITVDGGYSIF
jgi:NAD(P)-dependent dehydrogenase (short-subunit alcohol dehydrogenase family)